MIVIVVTLGAGILASIIFPEKKEAAEDKENAAANGEAAEKAADSAAE